MTWYDELEFNTLLGKTLTACVYNEGNEEIIFTVDDGSEYKLYHGQNCCESVYVENINGNLSDLVGSPLVLAEEVSNESDPPPLNEYDDSYTWTFYRLGTAKGFVDIRWYGSSNGYYSERVSFSKIN